MLYIPEIIKNNKIIKKESILMLAFSQEFKAVTADQPPYLFAFGF